MTTLPLNYTVIIIFNKIFFEEAVIFIMDKHKKGSHPPLDYLCENMRRVEYHHIYWRLAWRNWKTFYSTSSTWAWNRRKVHPSSEETTTCWAEWLQASLPDVTHHEDHGVLLQHEATGPPCPQPSEVCIPGKDGSGGCYLHSITIPLPTGRWELHFWASPAPSSLSSHYSSEINRYDRDGSGLTSGGMDYRLPNRQSSVQYVWLGECRSEMVVSSTEALQETVLSPVQCITF